MSPRMEPDFDWGDVQASIPIFPKGDYEITIKSIRGGAWAKNVGGLPTGEIVQVLRLRPTIQGMYDSKGKLKATGSDGKAIAGATAEDVNLWLHSEGGRRMAKQLMMAIAGFNPNDEGDERKFNTLIKEQKLDLSFSPEEQEDGSYRLTFGSGWETLLVNKNVRAHMEPETREVEGRDPVTSQNYVRLSPVNP